MSHPIMPQYFVEILKSIGIDFPKNCTRATIKLDPSMPVLIECEIFGGLAGDEVKTIHRRYRMVELPESFSLDEMIDKRADEALEEIARMAKNALLVINDMTHLVPTRYLRRNGDSWAYYSGAGRPRRYDE